MVNITDELVEAVAQKMAFQGAEGRMHAQEAARWWDRGLTDAGREQYRKNALEILELINLEAAIK